jgi:ion channel-forming bestrophin family protein
MIDYDPHVWRHHLFDLKGSMLKQIIYRVLLVVGWSAGVVYIEKYLYKIDIPTTVHMLVGVALGLLLVFRTNASYERFWDGRKLWGAMVNESRNMARLSRELLYDQAPELHGQLVRWTSAFTYATMTTLRQKKGAPRSISLGPCGSELPADQVKEVLLAQHVPNAVAARMTAIVNEARKRGLLPDIMFSSLDQNTQLLIDYMGGCERIHKTPLPFAYVVHLRRALLLYFFSLPFALCKEFGWGAVGATFAVSYVYFGIEEIGVEIEDPFGEDDNDLPLDAICESIRKNLLAFIPGPQSEDLKTNG